MSYTPPWSACASSSSRCSTRRPPGARCPTSPRSTPISAREVLEQAGRFAQDVIAPLNGPADLQGCAWQPGGAVRTPDGFPAAWRAFVEGGWPALPCAPEDGGQGLPQLLNAALYEMLGRRQPRLDDVSRPAARRLRGDPPPRRAGAARALPAQGGQRRMAGDDEPDRAARRQRPRPDPHPLRAAGCGRAGRQRRSGHGHRPEDLHLRRRPGHDGQHRPPGAGAPARRAGRHQGPDAGAGARRSCPTAGATAPGAMASRRRWASRAAPPRRCARAGRGLDPGRAAMPAWRRCS